ncbi:MAG: hypothetical protein C0412_17475 [Flavobacterium sp.]|nr:hypothetical protein [Flavobacterium sp.]
MCEHKNKEIICDIDRTGRRINAVICKNCGLVFIDPIPNKEWYLNYYINDYRREMMENKCVAKMEYSPERIYKQAIQYAKTHLNFGYVGETVVEVGSSSGGILQFFKTAGFKVVGIEPNREEAEYANMIGIKTINKLFEETNDDIGQADNILCIQSLNHLIEPHKFLLWAKHHLTNTGTLTLSVANWEKYIKIIGFISKTIQIDHPFMFTPRTLKKVLSDCGFYVIKENNDNVHIIIQAKAGYSDNKSSYKDEMEMIKNNKRSFAFWFCKHGIKKMWKKFKLKIITKLKRYGVY